MATRVPTATLSNGLRVANFSSPHPFTFSDGTVLDACSAERARELMLDHVESEFEKSKLINDEFSTWIDIKLEFKLSPAVDAEIGRLQQDETIDLIIVPLPVMAAIKSDHNFATKCRVVRVKDRVTKVIHHDRFCI